MYQNHSYLIGKDFFNCSHQPTSKYHSLTNSQLPYNSNIIPKSTHSAFNQLSNLRTQFPQTVYPNLKNKNLNHPGYKTRPSYDVYEQNIELVYTSKHTKGSIFIGNLEAAENLQTLKNKNIGGLLTACRGVHISHPKSYVPHYMYIPGDDHEKYDIYQHFSSAVEFIKQTIKQTNILVHCMAGISRSVSLVLAYLMKEQGYSFNDAFMQLKRKRKIINPNPGFIKQLKLYENQIMKELMYNQNNNSNTNKHNNKNNNKTTLNNNRSFTHIKKTQNYLNKSHHQRVNEKERQRKQHGFSPENSYQPKGYGYLIDQSMYSSSVHPNINHSKAQIYNSKAYNKNFFSSSVQYKDQAPKYEDFIDEKKSNATKSKSKYLANYKQYNELNKQLQQKIQAIKSKYQQFTKQLSENRTKNAKQTSLSNKQLKQSAQKGDKRPLQIHNKAYNTIGKLHNQSIYDGRYDFTYYDNFYQKGHLNSSLQGSGQKNSEIKTTHSISAFTRKSYQQNRSNPRINKY